MKQAIAVYVKKAIVKIAKEFAVIESNSTCSLWEFQSKQPPEIKKLRKC